MVDTDQQVGPDGPAVGIEEAAGAFKMAALEASGSTGVEVADGGGAHFMPLGQVDELTAWLFRRPGQWPSRSEPMAGRACSVAGHLPISVL